MITQELVKSLFDYDPNTGVFKRKVTVSNNAKVGQILDSKNNHGYLQAAIKKKSFKVHRLIWLYVYGEFPEDTIDHINGIRDDNRIENLRACTNKENLQNKKLFIKYH